MSITLIIRLISLYPTGRWREVSGASPPPRFSSVSGVSSDAFYVTTGEGPNRGFYDDIWKFDLK